MSENVTAFTKKILWVFGIVFILRCAISFGEIQTQFSAYLILGYIGEAITITMIIAAIYEKYLWAFDKTCKVPVIKGRYKGTIMSNWDNKKRRAELEIKQSLLKISVIMKTDESSNGSIFASVDEILGENQLIYTYLNKPKASVRDRSEVHFGTAMLYCDESGKLKGSYFTDRNTTGDMTFEKEKK